MTSKLFRTLLALATAGALGAASADCYVDGESGNDIWGDGSHGNPYKTIQAAVDSDAGTIYVGAGTYDPVIVKSGYAYHIIAEAGPEHTVIDGKGSKCCLYVDGGSYDMYSEDVVLEGFTLQNGYADDGGGAHGGCLYRCVLKGNVAAFRGGGSYCSILDNCLVVDNRVDGSRTTKHGGTCAGGGTFASFLYNCTVAGNNANPSGAGAAWGGGTYSFCQISEEEDIGYRSTEKGALDSLDDWGISESETAAYGGVYNSIVYNNKVNGTEEDCCFDIPKFESVGSLIGVNPGFANGYHPGEGSPAIDAGAYLEEAEWFEWHLGLDLDGNPRHRGQSVDIGCYESSGTPFAVGFKPWHSAINQATHMEIRGWEEEWNGSWSLTCPSWMHPEVSSGNGEGEIEFEIEANATGRARTGNVTVTSNGKSFTLPVTQAAAATAGSTTYGLFVGVEYYKNGYASNCGGCTADANHVYDAFTTKGNCTASTATKLVNGDAKKSSIRENLKRLAENAKSGDVVIYTHSSHGGLAWNDDGTPTTKASICAYDQEYTDEELAEDLDGFAAGVRVIVILDTCHSAGMSGRRDAGTPQKTAKGRGSASAFAARVQSMLKARRSKRLSASRDSYKGGAEVGFLAAANYYRSSFGDYDSNSGRFTGGMFTNALLEGLEEGTADDEGDNDDQTNFYELFCHAAENARGYYEYRNHFDESDPQCFNEAVLLSTLADKGEDTGGTEPVPQPKVAVSKFTMNGHQAVVCGVIGATADSFKSTDNCGNPCLIDSRIIDAEKSADWVDDNYWCTALSQMDMLVWLGWAKDIGYEDEDALANYFRKNPSLLRTKPSKQSEYVGPTDGTYGYNGVFKWFADQPGGQTLDIQSGRIGASFLQVLQDALQDGNAWVRMDVVSDCTSKPWLSLKGNISHSVICCGYALDPAVSSTSPSALVGLFLIDSDNDQYAGAGGTSAPNSISYVSATWTGSRYDFTNVWGGRDGYADWSCVYDVLYAKPGYTPVGFEVSGTQPGPNPPAPATQVADPVLDPPSNTTFTASLMVKCTCPTADATIRVTTNDTEVTESSPTWTNLTLTATTVVRVRAYKSGLKASNEVKFTYTCEGSGDDDRKSSLWTDPVVSVGKKDELEATSATSYTGWLHDAKGNLTGSFTMKVGKANKNGIAKATLTVTDLATGLKSKYTGNYNVEDGAFEDGQLEDLEVGANGVVGKIGKETLTGGRTADKQEAQSIDSVYKNRIFAFAFQNTAGKNVKGAATFTAKFSSKGKAKISGTLMDGTKVSTTAQLIVGDKACALPIAFSKKGKANFGLVLWFNEKKAGFKEATGLTECTLGDGVTDVKVEFVDCAEVDGSLPKAKSLEVDGKKVADIVVNGTKWVATAAKGFEDAKPKVTCAAKKGTITGTYKATGKGAAKPVSAKITGVWLGKTGVGTAVMKVNKVTTALPVLIK